MYLSRLILNPRSPQVRSEVSQPYQMHRTIMRAFPSAPAAGSGRVLFRLNNPTQPGLTLLVQSEQQPNWDWLAGLSRYLWPDCDLNPAQKAFDPSFSSGQRLYFRLRANPTVKRNNKRWGLYQEVQQRNWLARKAEQGGFALLGMTVTAEGGVGGKIHRSTGESHNLNLLAVRFDGLLQVTDPVNFLETLRQGIGSGKGLGFGLLSLAQG